MSSTVCLRHCILVPSCVGVVIVQDARFTACEIGSRNTGNNIRVRTAINRNALTHTSAPKQHLCNRLLLVTSYAKTGHLLSLITFHSSKRLYTPSVHTFLLVPSEKQDVLPASPQQTRRPRSSLKGPHVCTSTLPLCLIWDRHNQGEHPARIDTRLKAPPAALPFFILEQEANVPSPGPMTVSHHPQPIQFSKKTSQDDASPGCLLMPSTQQAVFLQPSAHSTHIWRHK
jgi:hypothetical protein